MLKLSRYKLQIWFNIVVLMISTSSLAQSDDDSSVETDPAAETGDQSYELTPEADEGTGAADTGIDAGDTTNEFPPDSANEFTPDGSELPPVGADEPTQAADTEPQTQPSTPWTFLSGSTCTVLPGIAKLTPSGIMKDLAGTGTQYGILLKHHMPANGAFGLNYGLDLRMAKLTKSLSAPDGKAANPTSRFRQSDIFALAVADYAFTPVLGAFFDFGLGVQYRSFYIKADSDVLADDYFAGYGFGYILRFGGQFEYALPSKMLLVTRLYVGMEGGSDLESGRLKYNLQKVDINSRQSLAGIDLGVHF